MRQHWDSSITWPIYFCSETLAPSDQSFRQLLVGTGPFHERKRRILRTLKEYDHIFFMLEEYWPTLPMTKQMFDGLYQMMLQHDWDCLHVDTVRPDLYKLIPTDHVLLNRRIWQFDSNSNWFFNQQAAFWKRDFLFKCVVPPATSEVEEKSSITVEIACDLYMRREYPDAKVMLYHYWWYPRGGVVCHGKITPAGEELTAQMNIDNWCEANKKPQFSG